MNNKLNDQYMPLNIIEVNAYEVIYRNILQLPIVADDSSYTGSIPMSLDLFKMFSLCEEDARRSKRSRLKKYMTRESSMSSLQITDAIINVSFDSPDIRLINRLDTISKEKFRGLDIHLDVPGSWKRRRREMLCDKYNKYFDHRSRYLELLGSRLEGQEYDKRELAEAINAARSKLVQFIDYYLKYCTELSQYRSEDTELTSHRKLCIRSYIYSQGVDIQQGSKGKPLHYIYYKRSASKAKTGSVVFIAEPLYDPMMKWTWLGLPVKDVEECDLTSMKAYEALVMSSICNRVRIKCPEESILMLDSVESDPVNGNVRILTLGESGEDERLELLTPDEYSKAKNMPFEHRNILWDGMALLDKSIFEDAGYDDDNPQGMMLLRNSFFKACAFNTNIQKYYADNNITEVTDMYGRRLDASKIRMIVTVDSLKVDKFADTFFAEGSVNNKECLDPHRCMYEYWLSHIDDIYGIVKEEHESRLAHGKIHEVSYQMLNTLPLTLEDMRSLARNDIDYIKLLRSDPVVMADRLRSSSSSARKRYFIYNMLKYSYDFATKSQYYNSFVLEEINKYRDKMKRGRLRLRSDFYVLCSMPMEMLEYSAHGDRSRVRPYLKGHEAHIDGLAGGDNITLLRYPHMNSGSFCSLRETENSEFVDKLNQYFNLRHNSGSNIVILSPYNSNVMVKLGGADFDSDTALFVRDETIQAAVSRLNDMECLEPGADGLPVALVDDGFKGAPIPYNNKSYLDVARLDSMLAGSAVGIISDTAQICNCFMWDYYNKNKGALSARGEEYLRFVYGRILMLSALNELEIDRTKHSIAIAPDAYKVLIENEVMDATRQLGYYPDDYFEIRNDNHRVVSRYAPMFFYDKKGRPSSMAPRSDAAGHPLLWDIPTDYIYTVLEEEAQNIRSAASESRRRKDDISDYFEYEDVQLGADNPRKLRDFRRRIIVLLDDLRAVDARKDMEESDKDAARDSILNQLQNDELVLETGEKTTQDQVAIMKRLISLVFARYTSSFNDHKKGDYKYVDIVKQKYRYLGLLFAIGDKLSGGNDSDNPAIKCIKGHDTYIQPTLKYEPSITPEMVADNENYVVIFGEVFRKA